MVPTSLGTLALATVILMILSRAPSAETLLTPVQLTEQPLERRAIEAVNWGMPAMRRVN
jgi:hypothetical protein